MKNVEVVDGALNSRFDIYAVGDEVFVQLFTGSDEVYLEDLSEELQNDAAFWDRFYAHEVDRHSVRGIHGILHTHSKAQVSILAQAVG